jgi:peptidyl-prolyl cis-trans isomerase SDCCAG10
LSNTLAGQEKISDTSSNAKNLKKPKAEVRRIPLWKQEKDLFTKNAGSKKKLQSEDDVLQALAKFQSKLRSQEPSSAQITEKGLSQENPENSLRSCMLHSVPGCLSCFDTFGEEDTRDDQGWMSHKLSFGKDYFGKDLVTKRSEDDGYIVIDPRAKMAQVKASLKRSK